MPSFATCNDCGNDDEYGFDTPDERAAWEQHHWLETGGMNGGHDNIFTRDVSVPRLLTSKYPGPCRRCGKPLRRGQFAIHVPGGLAGDCCTPLEAHHG